jgi:hypothetical protein
MNRAARRQRDRGFRSLAKASKRQIGLLNKQAEAEGWGEWKEKDTQGEQANALRDFSGINVYPEQFWYNNVYSVQLYRHTTDWGEVMQLLVREHNQSADIPWRDLQRIKNELVGHDWIAIEVFPTQEDLIDQANCFHLWVLPYGFKLPFGLHMKGWAGGR